MLRRIRCSKQTMTTSSTDLEYSATSASGGRSNAMAIHLASDVGTSTSTASMRRIAVPMASKSPKSSDR